MTAAQIEELVANLTSDELIHLQVSLQERFLIPCWWTAKDCKLSPKDFASFREWCHAGIDFEEDEFMEALRCGWEQDEEWIDPPDEGGEDAG